MIAITAERIAANFDHALSQGNNHGISEAVGLYTAGALFPEFNAAEAWKQRGHAALESEGRTLIYDDGAFAQQRPSGYACVGEFGRFSSCCLAPLA